MCKFGNVRSILKTTFTLSVPSEIIAITRITAQTHCLFILIHSATNRRCFEEVTYGNVTIPKDMTVHLNMADLHYNPDLWGAHSPDLFVPERYFCLVLVIISTLQLFYCDSTKYELKIVYFWAQTGG